MSVSIDTVLEIFTNPEDLKISIYEVDKGKFSISVYRESVVNPLILPRCSYYESKVDALARLENILISCCDRSCIQNSKNSMQYLNHEWIRAILSILKISNVVCTKSLSFIEERQIV